MFVLILSERQERLSSGTRQKGRRTYWLWYRISWLMPTADLQYDSFQRDKGKDSYPWSCPQETRNSKNSPEKHWLENKTNIQNPNEVSAFIHIVQLESIWNSCSTSKFSKAFSTQEKIHNFCVSFVPPNATIPSINMNKSLSALCFPTLVTKVFSSTTCMLYISFFHFT